MRFVLSGQVVCPGWLWAIFWCKTKMHPSFLKSIHTGSREIGPGQPPFVIAEMSANHNQSLRRALKIVEDAAEAGADAIKLQTYTPESMTMDIQRKDFLISSRNSPWKGKSLFRLYDEAHKIGRAHV